MANCIKCKAALPEGALFCPMCGKKQTSTDRKSSKRSNGMGTVYKRGDTWQIEITKGYKVKDGKTRRVRAYKGGFRTKKEALEYIHKYAIPRGYATLNMAQYLTVTGEDGASRASFTDEQLKLIKKEINEVPYADYIYCMCYLGFRPSEFLALDVKDYDGKNKAITGGAKTEAGKNRTVTISPKIQPIIDRLTKDKISGPIFCDENGNPFRYDYFRDEIFYPALAKIGIENPIENDRHKYSPHTCRHTFATLMKNIPASDKDKLELIGHASPEMLRYYQDVRIDDLKKITDAI